MIKIQSTAYPESICRTFEDFKEYIQRELIMTRVSNEFKQKLFECQQSIFKCKQLKTK